MKKIIFSLVAISIAVLVSAQTKTANYMKKIPSLPGDSCNVSRAGIESFKTLVSIMSEEISNDIGTLKKLEKKSAANDEAAAKEAALKQMSQYGMSQEDMEKMKNAKNMSAADKQAMANKMMQQQTNMSPDEIKNLSKMSDAGKKAYAEGYATEAMAVSQANPESQPADNKPQNISELLSQQQSIAGRISGYEQSIGNIYASIENDPSRQEMLDRIDNWKSQYGRMIGVDYGQGKQMDSLALLVKKEQIKYCDQFTLKYRAALRQHKQMLNSALPDYQKLGEVISQVTMAQTGIAPPPECTEIGALEAIHEYLGKLNKTYKFKLYFPEDD
jgi:hypothetical protein